VVRGRDGPAPPPREKEKAMSKVAFEFSLKVQIGRFVIEIRIKR
jgi:hypothetical protein